MKVSLAALSLVMSSSLFYGELPLVTEASAHERAFPTRQLKALSFGSAELTFKEAGIKPSKEKLAEFEKKYALSFSKGELAGPLYIGSNKEKKVMAVAVFLDGKSESGDTEFGAAVDSTGKLAKVAVYSSPESSDATSADFLKSLEGKSSDELDALRKGLSDKEKSKKLIVELAQKAIGRVNASFAKK